MRVLVLCAAVLAAVPTVVTAAQPYGDDEIEVKVGQPFTISSAAGEYNFPTLHQISQKQLFVNIWATPDADLAEEQVNEAGVWTEDGGVTWGKPVAFHGKETGSHSWMRRRDGSCLWLSYLTYFLDDHTVRCNVGRSTDGKTYSWSEGRLTLPEAVAPSQSGPAAGVYFQRSILEMPDGSLLAGIHGRFASAPGKFRSMVARSTDNGATWAYYATVAYSPAAPGEGFNETAMARTSNGDLLCVMRVGALPMWSSRSRDGGRTWTHPRQLPDYASGVFPDMVLMKSGILAVSFGRPGLHIMFSVDGKGLRWTSRTTLPLTGSSDCYTGIREVAPGRLLYVYNEALPEGNAIRGVFVDVKRQ